MDEESKESKEWNDPRGICDPCDLLPITRHDQLMALLFVVLYPLCFISGILVAHLFHV